MWYQNGRSSVIGLQYFCGPIKEVLTFGGEAWDSLLFTFLQMGNPLSFSSILCKNQLSWFLIKWFSAYAFHKTKDHLQGIVTLCFMTYQLWVSHVTKYHNNFEGKNSKHRVTIPCKWSFSDFHMKSSAFCAFHMRFSVLFTFPCF